MRALLLTLACTLACSSLADDGIDGVCAGSEEQCAETEAVRFWLHTNVEGYADDGLRTEWRREIDGYTYRPRTIVVTSARAVCHEALHAHLWRTSGDPCSNHEQACGWDEATESACKATTP